MRNIDILKIAWKNLKANRMRSFLTVFGIAVGISTIVFLVSLGNGLQQLSINKITSISSLTALDVTSAQGSLELTDNVLNDFKKIPNVEDVLPLLSLAGQVAMGENHVDIVGYGVNSKYFGYQGTKIATGGIFNNDNQTVISSGTAKALNLSPNDILGKNITFIAFFPRKNSNELEKKEFTFQVGGIIDDNSSSFAYFPLIKDFIKSDSVYSSVKVKVASTEKVGTVKEAIQAKGFKVSSIADTINQVYQIFKIVQIVLATFGVIALFVASIGMFNTMTIALLERTRDIGIMKSIGIQNNTVRKIFLTESFLISFFGGIFGAFLGIIAGKIVNLIVNTLATSFGGQAEKIFAVPFIIVLLIVAFSVLVGAATGFYPAKRAGKLNPLEALRYE